VLSFTSDSNSSGSERRFDVLVASAASPRVLRGASANGFGALDYDIAYSQNGTLNVVTQASLSGGDLLPAGTNTITLIIHSTGVTPVKIDALAANAEGAGVNVSWTAVSEFKNLGFNVYRREWVGRLDALQFGADRRTHHERDEMNYSFYDWLLAGRLSKARKREFVERA